MKRTHRIAVSKRTYKALIERHDDDGIYYVITCPSLPGLVSEGRTLKEARAMAKEAIELHLEGLAEHGQPIPPSDEDKTVKITAEPITVSLKRA